jgi:hypothetical protein
MRQALFFPTLPFLALKQLLLAPNQVVDPNLKAASLHEVKKI